MLIVPRGMFARMESVYQLGVSDLPPEKESSFMLDWKIRKGATDGQKVLHTGADSQQAA